MAVDGASSLAADSRFFDRLVDLVPARHYLATADGGGAAVAAKFLKRAEREAAKAASRAHRKVAKRSKLDGGDGERSTLELQRAAAEKAAAGGGSSGSEEESGCEVEDSNDEADAGARGPAPSAAARAAGPRAAGQLSLAAVAAPATKADLRARLAARIEALRAGRKAAESAEKVERAKGWRDARLERGRKEAAKKRTLAALAPAPAPRGGAERKERGGARPAGGTRPAAAAPPRPDAGGGLSFNRLDFGDDGRGPRGRAAGRKASKPELLAAAEAKRAAGAGTAAAHGGPPAPGAEAREAWAAAMERARGNKVLDDPKLLRKSIKREAKGKAKSAAAWKERASKQRAEVGAKQDRRRANLQGRVDAKVEAKKAKREKRLLRAGFEGRRRGPIGTPSPGGASKGGGK
jgi:hypothetical protein